MEIVFDIELDPFEKSNEITESSKYKQLATLHFGETDQNRKESIKLFREKLQAESPELLKNLPGGDGDAFLLKVLRAGTKSGEKGELDIENSTQLLKNFTGMMRSGPQYFKPAFEPEHKDLKKAYAQMTHLALKHRQGMIDLTGIISCFSNAQDDLSSGWVK